MIDYYALYVFSHIFSQSNPKESPTINKIQDATCSNVKMLHIIHSYTTLHIILVIYFWSKAPINDNDMLTNGSISDIRSEIDSIYTS